jgi:beta-glucanase (GH16 family)
VKKDTAWCICPSGFRTTDDGLGCVSNVPDDAGASDAGASDAGVSDAGVSDAGASDAGARDAGVPSLEYHLTFDEEFNDTTDFVATDAGPAPGRRWATTDFYGVRGPNVLESQYFADPNGVPQGVTLAPYDAFLATTGVLAIAAQPTPVGVYSGGALHVSGQLTTAHRYTQRYGYYELRARLPRGLGLWSRFWLLNDDGAWPGQGEYDIFEVLGKSTGVVHQTTHYTDVNGVKSADGFSATSIDPLDGQFHTYGFLWGPTQVEWYVDGTKTLTQSNRVDIPMYALIDLAIGGNDPSATWAGNPDSTTPWPARMEVESFRIYSNDPSLPSVTPDPGYSASVLPAGLVVVAGSPSPPLPTGWSAGPIGTPDLPGSSTWNPSTGEWMLKGAGYGYQCQFASTSLPGDGVVSATVQALTAINSNDDRAGVALRAGLQEVEPEVSLVYMISSNVPSVVRRVVLLSRGNGPTTELAAVTTTETHVSLRLERHGNTVTGSYSTNAGAGWTVVGSTQSTGLTGALRAGLVVGGNGNNYHRLSRGIFTDVSVSN